jgi:hypothetical protein
MLNREQYNDDEVVLHDFDMKEYNKLIEDGYKPFSSWFESMSKKFKYDRRKIAQELECDFLGSGDGVIPGDIQENIAKNMIQLNFSGFGLAPLLTSFPLMEDDGLPSPYY